MKITRKLCLEIFDWCKAKYGKSKHYDDFPRLTFRTKAKTTADAGPLKGEFLFLKNVIVVYAEEHYKEEDPILDVINTIIHEYKHHLQDMSKYNMYYEKYNYSYKSHPYEKTCDRFALREQYECFYHINRKLQKSLTPPLTS